MLVDALPQYDWSVIKAGLAVGYAESYAKSMLVHRANHDVTLSKAIEAKRKVLQQETAEVQGFNWREEAIKLYFTSLEAEDRTNANTTLRMLGQHLGTFEADNRQKGVQSLAELAQSILQRKRELQGQTEPERKAIEGTVIDAQDGTD
jgi:hypothetical protein